MSLVKITDREYEYDNGEYHGLVNIKFTKTGIVIENHYVIKWEDVDKVREQLN